MQHFIRALFVIFFLCAPVILTAQPYCGTGGHIPPCHTHENSICYGYAMGKAFKKANNDATCSPTNIYANSVSGTYFDFYSGSSLSGLRVGDIISFGTGSGLGGHAAFVVDIPTDEEDEEDEEPTPTPEWVPGIASGYADADVIVDQVPFEGGSPQTVTLSYVKSSQPNPTGYYRLKEAYKISSTFKNSFNAGLVRVGKDKFGDWKELDSGRLVSFFPNTTVEIMAIDSPSYGGYLWHYQNWSSSQGGNPIATNPQFRTISQTATYTANFKKEYNITFQNSLPGGSGGQIKVAGVTQNAAYLTHVLQDATIQGQGLFQVVNGIAYTFNKWNDNVTTNPRTFTPADHTTYTAIYTAVPVAPAGVSATGSVGNPVQITWTDNPNTNVTQYQIYRSEKPLGGQESSFELLATVNKGVQQFTDYSYNATTTYTDYLLRYGVRAYFATNGAYSSMSETTEFGAPGADMADNSKNKTKTVSELPTDFTVSSYPNPFNPSTMLSYTLAEDAEVTLAIYDMMGREVAMLVKGDKSAGYHSVQWNGKDVSSSPVATGTYIYRLVATPLSNKPQGGRQPVVLSGKLLLTK